MGDGSEDSGFGLGSVTAWMAFSVLYEDLGRSPCEILFSCKDLFWPHSIVESCPRSEIPGPPTQPNLRASMSLSLVDNPTLSMAS